MSNDSGLREVQKGSVGVFRENEFLENPSVSMAEPVPCIWLPQEETPVESCPQLLFSTASGWYGFPPRAWASVCLAEMCLASPHLPSCSLKEVSVEISMIHLSLWLCPWRCPIDSEICVGVIWHDDSRACWVICWFPPWMKFVGPEYLGKCPTYCRRRRIQVISCHLISCFVMSPAHVSGGVWHFLNSISFL